MTKESPVNMYVEETDENMYGKVTGRHKYMQKYLFTFILHDKYVQMHLKVNKVWNTYSFAHG